MTWIVGADYCISYVYYSYNCFPGPELLFSFVLLYNGYETLYVNS